MNIKRRIWCANTSGGGRQEIAPPHGSIDAVVENCLPSEHDQLDVRLALAPRLAAQPTPTQTPALM